MTVESKAKELIHSFVGFFGNDIAKRAALIYCDMMLQELAIGKCATASIECYQYWQEVKQIVLSTKQ